MTLYKKYYNEFQSKYLMYIPLTIILQSCIGSIAAMFILKTGLDTVSSLVELFLCVILCMFYNAAILAQLKGKIVFNILIFSLLFNVIFIVINVMQL